MSFHDAPDTLPRATDLHRFGAAGAGAADFPAGLPVGPPRGAWAPPPPPPPHRVDECNRRAVHALGVTVLAGAVSVIGLWWLGQLPSPPGDAMTAPMLMLWTVPVLAVIATRMAFRAPLARGAHQAAAVLAGVGSIGLLSVSIPVDLIVLVFWPMRHLNHIFC